MSAAADIIGLGFALLVMWGIVEGMIALCERTSIEEESPDTQRSMRRLEDE